MTAWTLPERVVRLAGDPLHLLLLGGEVELHHPIASRVVVPARVDRSVDAALDEGHRRVGHDGRTVGDPGKDRIARLIEIVDDLDAEAVLLERDDRVCERPLVGQRREGIG